MGTNRVFFPQEALDRWLVEGRVEISGTELVIPNERRRYQLVEAIRVTAVEPGYADVAELVGKVKTVVYLSALGAELLGDSMVLSDSAYRVLPGWLGSPIGTLAQHRASREVLRVSRRPRPAHGSDEELLADFLARNL
jgi:hypothetical protein